MMRAKYTSVPPNEPQVTVRRTKPAFGYYGAKQRISSTIVDLLPPHNAWVEVFCGSSAITLAKDPALIEVINDLDGNVVNLFNQLRENKRRLINAVRFTPYARAEFEGAKHISDADSDLERARKFLVRAMMTVNATVSGRNCGFSYSVAYARNGTEARVNRWNQLPERILRVADRLKNARIENQDARSILNAFIDRPATLMYLDPPYFVDRSHQYPVDAQDRCFHEELLELCCTSKAMLLISSYDNKLYQRYLNKNSGWKRLVIKTTTRDTQGRDFQRKEVLWMNRQFVKARENNRVPIRLSRKERASHKVNPPR